MKIFLVMYFFLFYSLSAQAESLVDSFAFYSGESKEGTDSFRIGYRDSIDNWLSSKNIPLSGVVVESSINFWNGAEPVYGVAVSPVFSAPLISIGKYKLNLNAGIGVSLISSKTIGSRDMSSFFQFEDRLGFQLKTDKVDFHALYMHYSNAGIVPPNKGIDIFTIGFNFKLN